MKQRLWNFVTPSLRLATFCSKHKFTLLISLLFSSLLLTACSNDDQHLGFCRKYAYLWEQLQRDDAPSIEEINQALMRELVTATPQELSEVELKQLVVRDYVRHKKPTEVDAFDFCVKSERWLAY